MNIGLVNEMKIICDRMEIDVHEWKAREYGLHTRFIELAGEINHGMPEWVIGKVTAALNERGKAVKASRCLTW